MELNVYQARAKAFLGDASLADQQTNGVFGLTGEAGEVADLVKKHRHHGHPWDRQKFLEELGDTLFYIGSLADEQGATLEEVAMLNLDKLLKRYPSGKFSSEESINRMEYKVLPENLEDIDIYDPKAVWTSHKGPGFDREGENK